MTKDSIPYIAVPSGKCKTCDEILASVFTSPEGEGMNLMNKFLKHLNEEHMGNKN